MKCDWIKENVIFYIYDELADDAKFEFVQHLHHCAGCRREVESAQLFKEDMAAAPMPEVSPNLLAQSRMQLQEALEHAEQNRSAWGMFIFDFAGWMHQIKLAPALTVALLMIGFAGGTITTWKLVKDNQQVAQGPEKIQDPGGNNGALSVATIDSISTDPQTNKVTIKYDTLRPQTLEGSADNPQIQQLLLLAQGVRNNTDVRIDSIEALKGRAQDDVVRDALISALRYDKNPGVRLKALDGLKSYVRDDIHVRDAVLEALLHDSNAGVRSEAIGLLDPVKADTSVREALQVLATSDANPYIRSQSKRYLSATPHLD